MNAFLSRLFRSKRHILSRHALSRLIVSTLGLSLATLVLPMLLVACGGGGGSSAGGQNSADASASLLPAQQMIPAGCSQVELLISAPPQEDSDFQLRLTFEGTSGARAAQVRGRVEGVLNIPGDWVNWAFDGDWTQYNLKLQGHNELGNVSITAQGDGRLANEPDIELSLSDLAIDVHLREQNNALSGREYILHGTVNSGKLEMDDAAQTSFKLAGATVRLLYVYDTQES